MAALVDAQILTEAGSDQRAEALHQEMTSLTAKMAALVDAQILTEAKFVESRETQTRIDDRLKALTHIVDRHVSGNGHDHSS